MKRNLILLAALGLIINSCQDKTLQTFMANVPVYMSYEELRTPLTISGGEELIHPGKIYFKDQFVYINEYQQGIHVVDLSDPENPTPKAFIEIPGNVDMAIRNNVLFADSYVDLLLIDISNPLQPQEIKRIEKLFEYVIPPYDEQYPLDEIDQEKGVITRYEVKEITHEIHHNPYPWPMFYKYDMLSSDSRVNYASGGGNGDSYGVGGSMARFLTYDNYLYALESTFKLKSIDISDIEKPFVAYDQYLWGNVETLFIADEHMYVGTSNGMHILSLEQPSIPTLLSTYQHVTACDPVVVEGNKAYVTLKAGNRCGGNQNLLEVIDISDKYEPRRMASFVMTEPYGLGIDNNTLFVCEGPHGLKVYDATDPLSITSHKMAEFSNIHAYDVIPLGSILFMIGDNGFYIYDYSDIEQISLLGTLPVKPLEQ